VTGPDRAKGYEASATSVNGAAWLFLAPALVLIFIFLVLVSLLVLVLIATGFSLFYQPLALLVGRRPLVEGIHVVAGLLLPVPTFVALLSAEFRADLARIVAEAPELPAGEATAIARVAGGRPDRAKLLAMNAVPGIFVVSPSLSPPASISAMRASGIV